MERFLVRTKLFSSPVLTLEASPQVLVEQGRWHEAARLHPLCTALRTHALAAFGQVRNTQLGNQPLVTVAGHLPGNVGSMVGTLFEYYFGQEICATGFRPQNSKHDCDFVCPTERLFDFEVKTTSSSSKDVFGNRVSATHTHKVGSYLLAVRYDPRSLQPLLVRFGWVAPSDWIAQRGNGQQAKLSPEARNRLLVL